MDVWATERVVIPPECSVAVPVNLAFPKGQNSVFVERHFAANGNVDDVYASPDSLISKEKPMLHVANFSSSPVMISKGQTLGTARDPKTWLDKMNGYSKDQQGRIHAHAAVLRTIINERLSAESEIAASQTPSLDPKVDPSVPFSATARSKTKISSKAEGNANEPDGPLAEEPLEGGPRLPRFQKSQFQGTSYSRKLISPRTSRSSSARLWRRSFFEISWHLVLTVGQGTMKARLKF
jgi:hypothetical protein